MLVLLRVRLSLLTSLQECVFPAFNHRPHFSMRLAKVTSSLSQSQELNLKSILLCWLWLRYKVIHQRNTSSLVDKDAFFICTKWICYSNVQLRLFAIWGPRIRQPSLGSFISIYRTVLLTWLLLPLTNALVAIRLKCLGRLCPLSNPDKWKI